jgi:hypothetical protein
MVNRRMLVAGVAIALAFVVGAFLHISYPFHSPERELGFGIQSAAIGLTLLWWAVAACLLISRWKSTSTGIRVLFALNCVIVFAALKEVADAFMQ